MMIAIIFLIVETEGCTILLVPFVGLSVLCLCDPVHFTFLFDILD
jgi:hypothetical protein